MFVRYGTEVCSTSPETRHYWLYWNSLEVHDRIVYKKVHAHNNKESTWQLLVPKAVRDKVLSDMHCSVLAGHLGRKKTAEKILQRYYWYQLREDVNNFTRKCDICSANKAPHRTPKAALGDMRVGYPLDRIQTDILGPLPMTLRQNKYILVVTDCFSKWTEAYAIKDQTAKTCAAVILEEFISRFGCPLDLHSDQGRNFDGQIFKHLCKLLEIRKTRTTPRHPQCNGQVERFNKTLIKMIKAYIKGDQESWDCQLGCLTAAYRASVHESTGYTPNMLMLGREVRLPGEFVHQIPTKQATNSLPEYVDHLKDRMEHAHMIARKYLKRNTERHQELYDGKLSVNTFSEGDLVWHLNENRTEGISPKLQDQYTGPYLVVGNYNDIDYCIQLDGKGTQRIVHHNKLKHYEGDKRLSWAKQALKKSSKS